MWKLKIPNAVKLFIWKTMHEILPTLSLLQKRGMQVESKCKWCGIEEENFIHLIWECSLANNWWHFHHAWYHLPPFTSQKISQVLLTLDKGKDSLGKLTCFCATLWLIWLTRNNKMFNGITTEQGVIEHLIKNKAWQWSRNDNLVEDKLVDLWKKNPSQAYTNHREA